MNVTAAITIVTCLVVGCVGVPALLALIDSYGGGFMAGYDRALTNNFLLGIAAGYSRTQIDGDDNSNASIDTPRVSLYGSYHLGGFSLDSSAGYAFDRIGVANPRTILGDGDEAASYLAGLGNYADRSRYPLPGLILLDLKLPRRSGFEVLQFIRSNEDVRHIPVVVLTSSDNEEDIKKAYAAGANSYLVKPVTRDALLAMVKALDAFWIKLNRATIA